MVKYTLVNNTGQPIEVSLTTNGGGNGSGSRVHIAAGKSDYWIRNPGNTQTFSATIKGGGTREFYNKNPGTYELKKGSTGAYILI